RHAAIIAEIQRLRHEQRRHIPGHLAHGGERGGFHIDQRRFEQPRGQGGVAASPAMSVSTAGAADRRSRFGHGPMPLCPLASTFGGSLKGTKRLSLTLNRAAAPSAVPRSSRAGAAD